MLSIDHPVTILKELREHIIPYKFGKAHCENID